MKKKYIAVAVAIVVVGGAFWSLQNRDEATTGRVMSIKSYVSANISELSPIKEQLGGTFYVTDISVDDDGGIVSYEDGHNAYVADFGYSHTAVGTISIDSFKVRE